MPPRKDSPRPHADRSATSPRSGRLAIAFQEPFTTVLRIKSARNPEVRAWVIKEIEKSAARAAQDGYSEDDIDQAKFAVVAFLDEAALYSENPVLANWKSVQAELYHSQDAGEIFFARLKDIQRRGNTSETADLLEIYVQCLLLGFEGKYRLGRWGDDTSKHSSIPAIVAPIAAQIRKLRQKNEFVQPWRLHGGPGIPTVSDPWLRRLIVLFVCLVVLAVLLFFGYRASLNRGLDQMRTIVHASKL